MDSVMVYEWNAAKARRAYFIKSALIALVIVAVMAIIIGAALVMGII
jgi:hypothetical protein